MLEYFLAIEIKVDFNYCSYIRLKNTHTLLKMSQRRPNQQHLIVTERQTKESRMIISEESRAEMRICFLPSKSEEKKL